MHQQGAKRPKRTVMVKGKCVTTPMRCANAKPQSVDSGIKMAKTRKDQNSNRALLTRNCLVHLLYNKLLGPPTTGCPVPTLGLMPSFFARIDPALSHRTVDGWTMVGVQNVALARADRKHEAVVADGVHWESRHSK